MTTKKTAISIILGALIIFIWNAISWMALPFHTDSMMNLPEDAISMSQLSNTLTESGLYHYPGLPDGSPESQKAIEDKLAMGPRITMMIFQKGPSSMYNPGDFFLTFIFNLIVVAILLYIVNKIGKKTQNNIFTTCVFAGILVSFQSDMALMNWYKFPIGYTVANIFDHIIAFGLVGLLFSNYTFKNSPLSND